MENIAADMIVRVRGEGGDAIREMDRVDRRFANLASSIARRGGLMRDAITTALGFAMGQVIDRAVRGVVQLGKTAIGFEASMANVNSIAQLSNVQLAKLSAQVNALAGKTAQAPEVLAAGLYDIYSSGFQGAAALQVLEASANAATAGLTTTDVAARAVTSTMNAYGQSTYTAQQISDVYFQTVQDGVLTFDELANNLGKTLPAASALGVGIEQLAAAYAQLTLNGVNASAAETNIASLLKGAANPTDAMTTAVQNYGYANAQLLLQSEGLPGLLNAVAAATGGNTEKLYELIPNQEAVNALLILLKNNGAGYRAEVEKMNVQLTKGGATQQALAKQQQSAAFALRQLRTSVQQLAVVFLGLFTPIITAAARAATYFTMALVPLADGVSRVGGFFGNIVGSGLKVESVMDRLFGGSKRLSVGMGALYQPTKRAGSAFQSLVKDMLIVFDSIGDLIARWQSKGFDGMVRILPRELGQIKDALWDVVKITANAALDKAVEIGKVGISIGKWAIEHAPDLWGWLKDELGLHRVATGDGTGGPDSDRSITLASVGVNVLNWAWGKITSVWGWLQEKIGVHGEEPVNIYTGEGGNAVTLRDVGVNVLSWAWGNVADLWGWLNDHFSLRSQPAAGSMNWGYVPDSGISLESVAVSIGSFAISHVAGWTADAIMQLQGWIDANAPADVAASINVTGLAVAFDKLAHLEFKAALQNFVATDPIKVTPQLELNIKQSVENWVRNAEMPDWKTALVLLFGPLGLAGAATLYVDKTLGPDLAKIVWAALQGAFAGLFTDQTMTIPILGDVKIQDSLAQRMWSGVFDQLNAGLDLIDDPFSDLGDSVIGWIGDEFDRIMNWLAHAVPEPIKLLANGDLMGAVKSIGNYFQTDNANHIVAINGALTPNFGPNGSGSVTAGYGSWANAANRPQANMLSRYVPSASEQSGVLASGELVTTLPATGTGAAARQTIPAPDISAYQRAMQTLAATTTMTTAMIGMSFARMGGQITSQLSGLAGVAGAEGQHIGSALGQGIVSGMQSWVQASALTAAQLVNAAITAAREAAGNPHSPSPVTEKLIGSPLGEGIYAGASKWKRKISDTMRDLATVEPYDGGGYAGSGTGGGRGGNVTVQVALAINAPIYGIDDLRGAIGDVFASDLVPKLTKILRNRQTNGQ